MFDDDDEVQEGSHDAVYTAGGRLLWLGDIEAGFKTQ